MYIFKYLVLSIIVVFTPSLLFSLIYENAEDKKTTKWSIIPSHSFGEVKNINDPSKKSRVIQLIGKQTKSIYLLNLKQKNVPKNHYNLSWEMKYTEDFVIMIELNTTKGKRTLIYTPSNEDSYLQYGLGETATLGLWKHYERDLEKDLNNFEKGSKILEIKNFVIKGSGFFDNIELLNSKKTTRQEITKKEKKVIKTKDAIKNKEANNMPVIYLNGKNPVLLQKGEQYIEAGATAVDKNGVSLTIDISHQIDILQEGEYSVIYMTTNPMGNSVIETRRVIVGSLDKKQSQTTNMVSNSEETEKLETRSKELLTWEKELEEREKELEIKEVIKEEKVDEVPTDYPSRPGL